MEFELNLYTNTSITCGSSPPNGVCYYNVNGNVLNLTRLVGQSFVGYGANNSGYIYGYSPCVNGLLCNQQYSGIDASVMLLREKINDLTCNPVLAYYDANIMPTYSQDDNYFQFVYTVEGGCDGGVDTVTIVEFYCDNSVQNLTIKYAAPIDDCVYKIEIDSSLACQRTQYKSKY